MKQWMAADLSQLDLLAGPDRQHAFLQRTKLTLLAAVGIVKARRQVSLLPGCSRRISCQARR
jgi:hypothetical protein